MIFSYITFDNKNNPLITSYPRLVSYEIHASCTKNKSLISHALLHRVSILERKKFNKNLLSGNFRSNYVEYKNKGDVKILSV